MVFIRSTFAMQVLEHKPYDHKADVYSFGIMIWLVSATSQLSFLQQFLSSPRDFEFVDLSWNLSQLLLDTGR